MATEIETKVSKMEAMLESTHQEWLQLATEKLSRADRNQRLLALDDRSVQLLELLQRKWKLEAEAEPTNP
jgi:hypothetical protein